MQKVRRAAGTETVLDVLLRWAWIRRRTPERDIEDFKNGQALQVFGVTTNIGGAVMVTVGRGKQIPRARPGYLRLAVGEEPVWRDRRGGRSAVLRAPFSLNPSEKKAALARKYDRYELVASDGTYDVVVPKKDAELVRYALGGSPGGKGE